MFRPCSRKLWQENARHIYFRRRCGGFQPTPRGETRISTRGLTSIPRYRPQMMRNSRHPASPQVTCNKQFSIQQFLSMPFYARSTPSKFHRRICRYRPFIIQPPVSSIPTSAFGNPVRHPVLRSSTTSCHSYFKSLDTTLQSGFINPARLSGCGERQHYPTLSNPPPFSYVFNLTSNSASHLSYSG